MKPTGCIRCGAAGNFAMHPLELVACEPCALAWLAEESCSVEAVEKVVGEFTGVPLVGYREHSKRFDAELLKRTEAWALAWRAAA